MDQAHFVAEQIAKIIEIIGVGVIAIGIIFAAAIFVWEGLKVSDWRAAYERFRANLGRGILLGLELLVGADIISTVTSPLTVVSVGMLGGVVLIRTFLSFSLETEIEGCWPWERAITASKGETKNVQR